MACFVGYRVPIQELEDIRVHGYLNPVLGMIDNDRLLTAIQMPRALSQNSPREASPTGKSGMGIFMAAMPQQAIFRAKPYPLTRQPVARQLYQGKLTNTAMVDPYSILKSQQTEMSAKKTY
jgi:hypothetical protein